MGDATVTDRTVEITGPFDPGALALTITWTDGNQTLNYTIRTPAAFIRANPTVTDRTVEITGPFDPGALALTITWTDGNQTLNYIIRTPAAFIRANPATQSELAVDDTLPSPLTIHQRTLP